MFSREERISNTCLAAVCTELQLEIALLGRLGQDSFRKKWIFPILLKLYNKGLVLDKSGCQLEFQTYLFLTSISVPVNKRNQNVLRSIIVPLVGFLIRNAKQNCSNNTIGYQWMLLEALLLGNKGNLKIFNDTQWSLLFELYTTSDTRKINPKIHRRVRSVEAMLKKYKAVIALELVKKQECDEMKHAAFTTDVGTNHNEPTDEGICLPNQMMSNELQNGMKNSQEVITQTYLDAKSSTSASTILARRKLRVAERVLRNLIKSHLHVTNRPELKSEIVGSGIKTQERNQWSFVPNKLVNFLSKLPWRK